MCLTFCASTLCLVHVQPCYDETTVRESPENCSRSKVGHFSTIWAEKPSLMTFILINNVHLYVAFASCSDEVQESLQHSALYLN